MQVVQYNEDTFVLRQNVCVHWEAPFTYLLFGNKGALLIDTGATANADHYPLRETVDALIARLGPDVEDVGSRRHLGRYRSHDPHHPLPRVRLPVLALQPPHRDRKRVAPPLVEIMKQTSEKKNLRAALGSTDR